MREIWRALTEEVDSVPLPGLTDWARGERLEVVGLWMKCPRADWLIAIALAAEVERPRIAAAAIACARRAAARAVDGTALRDLLAIAERSARGEAGTDEHEGALRVARELAAQRGAPENPLALPARAAEYALEAAAGVPWWRRSALWTVDAAVRNARAEGATEEGAWGETCDAVRRALDVRGVEAAWRRRRG